MIESHEGGADNVGFAILVNVPKERGAKRK